MMFTVERNPTETGMAHVNSANLMLAFRISATRQLIGADSIASVKAA